MISLALDLIGEIGYFALDCVVFHVDVLV